MKMEEQVQGEAVILVNEPQKAPGTGRKNWITAIVAVIGICLVVFGIKMIVDDIREHREEVIVDSVKSACLDGYEGVTFEKILRNIDDNKDPDWVYMGELIPWLEEILIADGTVSIQPDSQYVMVVTSSWYEIGDESEWALWYHLFEINKDGNKVPVCLVTSNPPDGDPRVFLTGDNLVSLYEGFSSILLS